jgi:hypothetical protein
MACKDNTSRCCISSFYSNNKNKGFLGIWISLGLFIGNIFRFSLTFVHCFWFKNLLRTFK